MKKKIIIFVFLILGILSISSCKQNNKEPKPSNEESNKQEIDGTYSLKSLSSDLSFVEYYTSITIENAICENVKLEKTVLEEDLSFFVSDNSCEPEEIIYKKGISCWHARKPLQENGDSEIEHIDLYIISVEDKLYYIRLLKESVLGYYSLTKIEDLLNTDGYYVKYAGIGCFLREKDNGQKMVDCIEIIKSKEQLNNICANINVVSTANLDEYNEEFFNKYDLIVISTNMQYKAIIGVSSVEVTDVVNVTLNYKYGSAAIIDIVSPYQIIIVAKKALIGDVTKLTIN